ncbi:hypothetical protein [Undibacterium arcticum]
MIKASGQNRRGLCPLSHGAAGIGGVRPTKGAAAISGGERGAAEANFAHVLLSGTLYRALRLDMVLQHLFGTVGALAATSRDTQIVAQLGHRTDAQIDRLPDFAIGYVVANTDNHRCTLLNGVNSLIWQLSATPLLPAHFLAAIPAGAMRCQQD